MSNEKLRFGLWYDFLNPPRWQRDNTELYHACFEQIERAEAVGFDDIYTWAVPPGLHPSWSDEHIELMGKEVIPAFR